jgi:folate-binding protein YgfZ
MPDTDLVLDRTRLDRVRHGATAVTGETAVFRISGSGALGCLQGMLTNDLEKPGENSLVYGALLTPKGMIVVDAWVLRQPDALTVLVPGRGSADAAGLFQRQLPPRLARVTNLTDQARVIWLVGGHGFHVLMDSGLPIPEAAGRVVVAGDAGSVLIALAPESAPFTAVLVALEPATDDPLARLLRAGATAGDEADLHAARVLGGWPTLGVEIDERTLPQEVRYDDIGGVSYTKGCYTGQETVARLHFRGHTNRELRGLRWSGTPPLDGRGVTLGEREVGSVRSTLTLEDRRLGLGTIRREIGPGEVVTAGGAEAKVVALPFGPDELDA